MSRRPLAAALLVAAVAAASASLLRAGVDPLTADGLPVMTGQWLGRVSIKTAGLDPSVEPEKIKNDAALDITQTGFNLIATLTLPQEGDDTVYNLHGQVGNGQFWLQGDTTGLGTPMQILGRVTGSTGTLKAKASGVITSLERAGTVSLQVSRPAE